MPVLNRPTTVWPLRRWISAVVSAVLFGLFVAVPTDLIDTPLFSRDIPPPWWAWPSLALSSVLAGLLVATSVANPVGDGTPKAIRGGYAGGLLTFFAVGCPVCNKLVLVALGSAGAMTWFEPIQPLLQVAAVAVLVWALRQRLRGERMCRRRSALDSGRGNRRRRRRLSRTGSHVL